MKKLFTPALLAVGLSLSATAVNATFMDGRKAIPEIKDGEVSKQVLMNYEESQTSLLSQAKSFKERISIETKKNPPDREKIMQLSCKEFKPIMEAIQGNDEALLAELPPNSKAQAHLKKTIDNNGKDIKDLDWGCGEYEKAASELRKLGIKF